MKERQKERRKKERKKEREFNICVNCTIRRLKVCHLLVIEYPS